jgi:hypothetical protein
VKVVTSKKEIKRNQEDLHNLVLCEWALVSIPFSRAKVG